MTTQYIKKDNGYTGYYADKEMTVLHRTDGPAIEYADGSKAWYVDDILHRLDGPAVEYANGSKSWWVVGKLHHTDGPAIEHAEGYKEWYVEGKLHRTDGPAVECADGYKEWWVDGKRLSKADYNKRYELKEISLEQIAEKFGIELSKLRIKP